MLDELARRARKLQGDWLGLEDFAQFLNLPVTDTLTQIHGLFDQVNTDRFKSGTAHFVFLQASKDANKSQTHLKVYIYN